MMSERDEREGGRDEGEWEMREEMRERGR